jgi:ABC-type amino acid transport substrate-binding protein
MNLCAHFLRAGCIAALALMGSHASAEMSTLERVSASGAITLAHGDTSFPFSYVDSSGEVRGYSIDICKRLVDAIAAEVKRPLTIRYVVAAGLKRVELISKGEADLECGSSTNNAKRREAVSFSYAHFIAGVRLMVKSDIPINKLDEMGGKKVATAKGSPASAVLRDRIRRLGLTIEHIEADSAANAFGMLARGEVDGLLNDDVLLYARRARSNNPSSWKIVDKTYTVEPMGIMFAQDDEFLKTIVNKAMRKMIVSGEIERIYSSWFLQKVPGESQALELPMNALTKDYFRRPVDINF